MRIALESKKDNLFMGYVVYMIRMMNRLLKTLSQLLMKDIRINGNLLPLQGVIYQIEYLSYFCILM